MGESRAVRKSPNAKFYQEAAKLAESAKAEGTIKKILYNSNFQSVSNFLLGLSCIEPY
jgi:hypothetical protein